MFVVSFVEYFSPFAGFHLRHSYGWCRRAGSGHVIVVSTRGLA